MQVDYQDQHATQSNDDKILMQDMSEQIEELQMMLSAALSENLENKEKLSS